MQPITIVCPRCGNRVSAHYEVVDGRLHTWGYFNLDHTLWARFKRYEEEHVVCDECMRADPRYQEECMRSFPS